MKRTPLKRKTPLRVTRIESKRDSIRVTHPERTAHLGRMKRKATDMNALEELHVARIKAMPCLVTGKRPVEAHHLMKAPDKRCRRDHRWVVPLHRDLHNGGQKSVHGLGTEAKFEREHGLAPGFLIVWAAKAWHETEEANR